MTPVNEIGRTSNCCVHTEVFGDLHPDNATENVSEANDTESQDMSQQGEQEVSAADGVKDLDRGWAWMVLPATLLIKALTMALPACMGIFYTDLQNEFNASNSEVSWVPAIMRSMRHAAGPICSGLEGKFGSRATVISGGLLSAVGLAASSQTQSIGWLYLTAGVTGFGLCLSYQPSVSIIGHYFVRLRALANALSSMGMALGMFFMPPLANYLNTEFGWRGSILILGAVLLNCCVCGAVMRLPVGHAMPLVKATPQAREEGSKMERWARLRSLPAAVSKCMAFDQFLQNSRYRVFVCGVTWMIVGFGVSIIYLVPYATFQGIERSQSTNVLICLGAVNLCTRPLFGVLFNKAWFKGRHIYVFSCALLLNGLGNCICCLGPGLPILFAYATVQGVSLSAVGSLIFTILMDLVEKSRFTAALGLFNLMHSVPLLLGPPLAGVLIDRTGQYFYVFVATSVVISSAAVFFMVAFYWLNKRQSVELVSTSSVSSAGDEDEASSSGVENTTSIPNPPPLRPRRQCRLPSNI